MPCRTLEQRLRAGDPLVPVQRNVSAGVSADHQLTFVRILPEGDDFLTALTVSKQQERCPHTLGLQPSLQVSDRLNRKWPAGSRRNRAPAASAGRNGWLTATWTTPRHGFVHPEEVSHEGLCRRLDRRNQTPPLGGSMTSRTGPALDLQASDPSPRSRVRRRTQFHTQSTTPLEETMPDRNPAVAGKHMQLLAKLTRAGARTAVVLPVCGVMLLGSATAASAATTAVTPGWECIPTTAGQAVVSGGDSASGPSCGSGTTAVLAPTYVAGGIDGKPTVKFASVNVQILDGSGATSTVNGTGNLVLGYDEDAGSQSGSHNLILGEDQTATSYADVIGGDANTVSAPYGAAFGAVNTVEGSSSFAAGETNFASGNTASVTGGNNNVASGELSSISGGERNTASGTQSAVTGGEDNTANEPLTSVFGGWANLAEEGFGAVFGGCANAVGPTAATDPGVWQPNR